MHTRFLTSLAAATLFSLATTSNLLAVSGNPATVQEAPSGGGTTQYTVNNTSSSMTSGGKFDISIFLSTTTGSSPTTTNSAWTAEAVNSTTWAEEMTGEGVTWQQYTGLTYTQAYPGNPAKLNGYFLDFTFNSDTDAISFPNSPAIPGSSLGGFNFTGSPSSTFFVDGPTDSTGTGVTSLTPGAGQVTFSGTSTDVPEPSGVAVAVLAASASLLRRRRELSPDNGSSSTCVNLQELLQRPIRPTSVDRGSWR
jgi:hypothetical protein